MGGAGDAELLNLNIEALYILRDVVWRLKSASVKYKNISRISRRFEFGAFGASGGSRTAWNTREAWHYSLAKDI